MYVIIHVQNMYKVKQPSDICICCTLVLVMTYLMSRLVVCDKWMCEHQFLRMWFGNF